MLRSHSRQRWRALGPAATWHMPASQRAKQRLALLVQELVQPLGRRLAAHEVCQPVEGQVRQLSKATRLAHERPIVAIRHACIASG